MVNYDLVFFGIFLVLLVIFYFRNRKHIELGLVSLYRTKLGTALSKKVVRKREKFFRIAGYIGIAFGFIGMILIFYLLIKGGFDIFLKPDAPPTVAPVLPFIKIPGLPPLLFTYWIIGIFVVAVIHEFSHALLSVAHNVKVKSSGFAFFGPIPAAFVEPDEKQLAKRSKAAQLSVFAAGPFSNIITGVIFFIIFAFLLSPSIVAIADANIRITQVIEGAPADTAGLKEGMLIEEINGLQATPQNVSEVFAKLKPNETLIISSAERVFEIKTGKNPQNESRGYIGISVESALKAKNQEDAKKFSILLWTQRLFFWLFVLSLGIGLFNLLPLGPIDGGKMLFVALTAFTKKENIVKRIFSFVSFVSLLFILINLSPWLLKLFGFLGGGG